MELDSSARDAYAPLKTSIVTSMMAQIAHDAYENTTYLADPIVCVDCKRAWGWRDGFDTRVGRVPIERFTCCNKQV